MPDEQSLQKRMTKKLVRIVTTILAMWAPIQGAYAYLAGGKLAWLGVSTSRDLPHLLFLMSYALGCWAIFFAIGLVFFTMVATGLAFVFPLKIFDFALRFLLTLGAIAAGLEALSITRDFLIHWDQPNHGVTDVGSVWALATLGGLAMVLVYVESFFRVRDALRELKKEEAL